MTSNSEIRAAWLAQLLSTDAADRPRAESAVGRLYAAAGFVEPRHVLWFDSPYDASWAVALLAAPHNPMWGNRFSLRGATRDDKQRAEKMRASLCDRLSASDWNQAASVVGLPRGGHLMWPPDPRAK